MKLTKS